MNTLNENISWCCIDIYDYPCSPNRPHWLNVNTCFVKYKTYIIHLFFMFLPLHYFAIHVRSSLMMHSDQAYENTYTECKAVKETGIFVIKFLSNTIFFPDCDICKDSRYLSRWNFDFGRIFKELHFNSTILLLIILLTRPCLTLCQHPFFSASASFFAISVLGARGIKNANLHFCFTSSVH